MVKKIQKGLYYILAKLVALFVIFVLAEKLGGFAEYAKEIIKITIAAQIVVSGIQLLLQQAAYKIGRLSLINVILINVLLSILYIKVAGLADSLVWGMAFYTCIPVVVAYNSGLNGRRGEILNILSIFLLQPLVYYSHKCFPVNLGMLELNYLLASLIILILFFINDIKIIDPKITINYVWRSTEVAFTQGVLLYFAEKLLHKSTNDEIIIYWLLMQLAGGIIFLANSFSYSIINYFIRVGAAKNYILEVLYKIGALSMSALLFLAIKTPHSEMYYGFLLIIQGIMKFPGYALLGQNKSHVLFISNVSSFVFILILSNLIEFDSFGAYIKIQIIAALTATALTYFQLRRQSGKLLNY